MTTPGNTVTPEMPKRYTLYCSGDSIEPDQSESVDGEWVKYADHFALLTEARELLEKAEKRSQFHKDNHLEAEKEIDRLRAELAQARRKEIVLFQAVMEVTAEHCKCGGSGPDDPNACDACKIYHALRPHFSEEATR